MQVYIPRVDKERNQFKWIDSTDESGPIQNSLETSTQLLAFQNKEPTWNETRQTHTLEFFNRAKISSTKNFQLVDSYDKDKIYVLFGKESQDIFNMDVHFPFSIFQAFCICVSSFDTKLLCEWEIDILK